LATDPEYGKQEAAELRAQAIANEKQIEVVVLKSEGGSFATVFEAKPGIRQAPPSAAESDKPKEEKKESGSAAANERLQVLAKHIGVPMPTAMPRFKSFWGGLLGIANMKEFPEAWDKLAAHEKEGSLLALEYMGYRDPEIFNSDPRAAGAIAARIIHGTNEFSQDTWPGNVTETKVDADRAKKLSWCVALAYNYTTPDHFMKWANKVGLDKTGPQDAVAFLRVALKTRNVFKISRIAETHGIPIKAIVDKIESTVGVIEDAAEGAIDSCLQDLEKQEDERLRQKANIAPPKTQDDDQEMMDFD
jgi:hypothetical protein